MFTGIIEEIGKIRRLTAGGVSARIEVEARTVLEGTKLGDSIAVNGVCLTVVKLGTGTFTADAAHETLKRTNLGDLKPGDSVNLERALRLGDRLGGHLVSGHVDGLAQLSSIAKDGVAHLFRFSCPAELHPYIAEKGSVAIDGISLTVAKLEPEGFTLSIIPHTAANTTLQHRNPGDRVNLECDQIAKYLARLAGFTGVSVGTLRTAGVSGVTDGGGRAESGERTNNGGLDRETLLRFGF